MERTDSVLVVLLTLILTLSAIPVSGEEETMDVNIVCTNPVIDVTPGQSSEDSIMCEIENLTGYRIKGNITIDAYSEIMFSWDHDEHNVWIEEDESIILYYNVGAAEGTNESQFMITTTFTVHQANGVPIQGNPETYRSLGIIQQYYDFSLNVDNDIPIMHIDDVFSFDVNITNLGNALTKFNIYRESGSKFSVYSLYNLEIERDMTETLIVVVSPIETACDDGTDYYEDQFLLGVWPASLDMAESIEYYESVLMLECIPDSDNDGLRDHIDLDDDNDGWSDEQESECGTNPLFSQSTPIDTDSDNLCDFIDMDDDGDGWSDSVEASCNSNTLNSTSLPLDTDSDLICDLLDDDDDGDGWSDSVEASCNSNTLNSTSLPLDTDSDLICDPLDDDDDGDGILDQLDAYPLDQDRYLAEPIDERNSSIIAILLLVIATLLIVIFRFQRH